MFINEDLKSSSFIYGLQAGIEKKVSKKYAIFAKYQYIKYDHNIEIRNNTSNIKHKAGQNLLIGLSYLF
ncbi:MAG: porin family protein [Cocleimonas sp.]|nr:porin family protein [Cocleimonas sp.]